jgi:hypothetical protein
MAGRRSGERWGTVADNEKADVLTYKGHVWEVESEPVVVESENGSDLVEVWVKRGEDIEQPRKS